MLHIASNKRHEHLDCAYLGPGALEWHEERSTTRYSSLPSLTSHLRAVYCTRRDTREIVFAKLLTTNVWVAATRVNVCRYKVSWYLTEFIDVYLNQFTKTEKMPVDEDTFSVYRKVYNAVRDELVSWSVCDKNTLYVIN